MDYLDMLAQMVQDKEITEEDMIYIDPDMFEEIEVENESIWY